MPHRDLLVFTIALLAALLACGCRSDLDGRFSRMDQLDAMAPGAGAPVDAQLDMGGGLEAGPLQSEGNGQQPTGLELEPDALYARPLSSTTSVGQPVRIVVETGVPAGPLAFMNGCAVSFSGPGADYVPGSFNVGAPGGEAWAVDGIWAAAAPQGFIQVDDLLLQWAVTAADGLTRMDFNVTPIYGTAITSAEGELFSFEATFSEPGTYRLGFVEFSDVKRTYYSDWDAKEYFWSDISNNHAGHANTITVN